MPPTNKEEVPNPGSKEAIDRGCICPVIDNHYGKGFMMRGEISFWITGDCPVHDKKEKASDIFY